MKNILILHGAGNNSSGNWFPWLKKELEKENYLVWSPDLPNSDTPMQKDWLNTIFSNKDWEFNKDTIIVGHSAGATLILRILENLSNDIKIDKAILVAGPVVVGTIQEHAPYKRDLMKTPFKWDKIKKSAKEFYFIYSDNDPYECGLENGVTIEKNLGGQLIIKSGEAHFNLEKSPDYKKFPLILELIEKY